MNETEIFIGGKTRILKGTFQNITDLEKSLKCSIMTFITPYAKEGMFQPSFEQASHIIYWGLNGNADNRLELRKIQEELAENGITEYLPTLIGYLIGCVSGSKKNPQAAELNTPSQ